jgi:hypothetical protein
LKEFVKCIQLKDFWLDVILEVKQKMKTIQEGLAAFKSKDYINAFKILKPLAEAENAEAQCIIANTAVCSFMRDSNSSGQTSFANA